MKVYARTPLDVGRFKVPRGQVYIIPERCKGCRVCVEYCPKGVLKESHMTNSKGYHYPEVIFMQEQECVHCEFCTLVCPEFAIFTLEAEQ